MKYYRFWAHENWGNEKDGWEFNNRWLTSYIVALPIDDKRFTDKELRTIVRRALFVSTFRKRIYLEYNDTEHIYIVREKDGYCYGELESIPKEDVDYVGQKEDDYIILFDKMLRNAATRR